MTDLRDMSCVYTLGVVYGQLIPESTAGEKKKGVHDYLGLVPTWLCMRGLHEPQANPLEQLEHPKPPKDEHVKISPTKNN